ncbi:hypothetical protein SAMN05660226_01636 [Parapedobacter luteus]|uniref:YceI-like domain-containing protein n=1 Tax=Parapedobacter luteus TaxID=623280 RepID=A0A1T5BQI4_9SPHI|nr:hypothetical protein [Parapedobacter luteus]SKB49180.1 hypothetical protein SAMN05660226_01636 [Parapedobacter luteus]
MKRKIATTKTFLSWNNLALITLVLVVSACAKNELPEVDEGEEDGYYVTMTVNGKRVDYKSGVTAALSKAPDETIDYQQFSLTVEGSEGIRRGIIGKEALFLNCFVYDTWKPNKKYENTFEPDETTGIADKQDQISVQYLTEALASQYVYVTNSSFQTGSAHVILKEVTSTYFKGTFHGVLSQAVLPYMTPLGNIVELETPLVIDGEFYARR